MSDPETNQGRRPQPRRLDFPPSRKNARRAGWRWAALRLGRTLLLTYLLIMLMMMFLENTLIFPARKYPAGDWSPRHLKHEEFDFQSADGTKLHGWYVAHPEPTAHVLLCHGNAEHVADLADLLEMLRDDFHVSVFAFDYRGYGRSAGKPHEAGVLADGLAAQAWLANHAAIEPQDIVIIGRSLGGAVAVNCAANNGARGLVLERTFTRLPDVAARHYPWLPVKLLMKSRFDSAAKIAQYDGPLLQSHGTADEVIPFEFGQQLFDAAPSSRKQFYTVPGGTHNEPQPREYWTVLRDFLWNLPQ